MYDSCCICRLVLATQESDFPEWCKTIRALCLVDCEPLLSGLGYVDNGIMPYNIEIPHHGSQRFCIRRTLTEMDEASDFCYPFHATCWDLLEDVDVDKLLNDHIGALYSIFESFHYDKNARALSWGHNFYIEMLNHAAGQGQEGSQEDVLATNNANYTILADPQLFSSSKEMILVFSLLKASLKFLDYIKALFQETVSAALGIRGSTTYLVQFKTEIESIPTEILESIFYRLHFCDAQHLFQASPALYRRYAKDPNNLPSSF